MVLADRLYDWLADGPAPDCDLILAAGLEHAEEPYFARLVRELVRRGQPAGWAGLIGSLPRLSEETRQQVVARPERMRSGLSHALRGGSPAARGNALRLFGEQPQPQLAYILADMLREPGEGLRSAAGDALRRAGLVLLERFAGSPASSEQREQRALFTAALREALRTYDLHRRQEVIETCLWWSRWLGDVLWETLATPRATAASVICARLRDWDSPLLAHFLLQALPRTEWRALAQQLLSAWHTPRHLAALLHETDLLDDPQVRQYLVCVRRPRWFEQVDDELSGLPAPLRTLAPTWLRYLGVTDEIKVAQLSRWLRCRDRGLRSAALYALGALEQTAALSLLEDVAAGNDTPALFARWCLAGRRSGLIRGGRPRGEYTVEAHGYMPFIPGQSSADSEFATLWQLCRRTPPERSESLYGVIREHLDQWGPRMLVYLRSPDARDRALVLHVLAPPELARRFQADWQMLLTDADEAIREEAQRLLRAVSTIGAPDAARPAEAAEEPDTSPPAEIPAVPPTPAVDVSALRREIRTLLDRLVNEDLDPAQSAALIHDVRLLLRELRGGAPLSGADDL